ncbi:HipA N-terminal domain-containing protein [Myroides pelagicus]|uniref:Phosphatidylinositol kinase n=1 Tax=Myroides pelagicus TaxID=270914 RepID=A0A7K1GR30_9FLAO|nr:HipA N-terminal domain-containing protein [Myroides pelagicus]MEC4114854.1 HipA N-terminal domain-containing protein [Myroides pelagicus]MTH30753.1 phosphatidylinositol kinase [Myroides pelagicus]
MRVAHILYKGERAGVLTQLDNGSFHFTYNEDWLSDDFKPAISLTLPKSQIEFESAALFPFFYHLLPEGVNKRMICKTYKIDQDDAFGLLLQASKVDTVGAVTIERM